MNIEDLKQQTKKGKYILVENQTFEEHISDLKDKLEDANNSLAGADGIIPERIVHLIDEKGLQIILHGKESVLKNGWK